MTCLTCHLIEMAAQEEAQLVDDEVYAESLESILANWATLCQV